MPDLALPETDVELGDAIRGLGKIFRAAGVPTAALDARLLASHACELSPEETIAKPSFVLSPEMTARIREAARRRLAGEPVSRIIGYREFWGLPFSLSPYTLDPRPETELLVEAVLAYVRENGLLNSPLRILDLGTGSGCLLGALLSELPAAYGVGVDLSAGAISTARENLRRLGLLTRASFLCADWAGALGDAAFDIIVTNPPYICSSEIAGLEAGVKAFDPHLALDGGDDGFEAFRAILAQTFRVLKDQWAPDIRNRLRASASGARDHGKGCAWDGCSRRSHFSRSEWNGACRCRSATVSGLRAQGQKKGWKSGSFGIGSV